jgi:hypothetical protein
MNQPKPLTYETKYKTVEIKSLDEIVTVNGIEGLDGGYIKYNGKSTKYIVQISNKPDLVEMVKSWRAEWEAYNTYKAAEFAKNVPGLAELEAARTAAYNAEQLYQQQVDRAMEDGTAFPKDVDPTLHQKVTRLTEDYPRAAVYLNAQGYTYSNNLDKYAAGKKAMKLIASGAEIEEAKAVL